MPYMPRVTPVRVIVGAVAAGILLLVAAGVALVALHAWDSPHFARSDLVGVYVAKYPTGTETLTLNPDGTWLQEVRLKEPPDSTPVSRMGSWTWDESAQRLRLHTAMPVNDGHGRINPAFQTDPGGGDYSLARKWLFFGQLYLGDWDSAPLWKVE